MKESKFVWMDGKFKKWNKAKVHVLSHTLHYGNGVIEGIKVYKTEKNEFVIFRLDEHIERLFESAKINMINIPFTKKELIKKTIKLLKKNNIQGDTYIRPHVFLGYGIMGLYHKNSPVNTVISSWPIEQHFNDIDNGIKVKVSSVTKLSNKSSMIKSKSVSNYINSQMAKCEAIDSGVDDAILLDDEGYVAEGTAASVFIVKNSILYTPPNDNSLKSITQMTVLEIAKVLGLKVVRKRITREELYIADEVFFTGTAIEISSIREIDKRKIGKNNYPISKKLRNKYFEIVKGSDKLFEKCLTYV